MLLLQLILYCLQFFLLVKCAAKDSRLNCIYFYPKEYINEAEKRGLATILYLIIALAVAGIVVLIGKI